MKFLLKSILISTLILAALSYKAEIHLNNDDLNILISNKANFTWKIVMAKDEETGKSYEVYNKNMQKLLIKRKLILKIINKYYKD